MCGILGIVGGGPFFIESASFALKHRGPDDSGVFFDKSSNVCLGHRRLSIIDLSNHGHQPMTESSGRYTIVFNGEIYNYRELYNSLSSKGFNFFSQSDTEVILNAYSEWGEECVYHLNGSLIDTINDLYLTHIFLCSDVLFVDYY